MPDAVAVSPKHRPYKPNDTDKRSKSAQLDLAYYQGQLANSPQDHSPRAASPSSSEYSCDSDAASGSQLRPTTRTLKHARRTSAISDVGTDRRRLAIVQMGRLDESRSKAVSDHGHDARSKSVAEPNLAGLAIVAPPDAAPSTYTHLSPPTSATHPRTGPNVLRKPSSRPLPPSKSSKNSQPPTSTTDRNAQVEQPSSARMATLIPSVLPLNVHSGSSSSINLSSSYVDQPLTTPPIGQTKDVHVPVAGPVVVNLGPSRPLHIAKSKTCRDDSSAPPIALQCSADSVGQRTDISYLHYQPGLHASAGPLPPPPRATFTIDSGSPPPPRPPRIQTPNPRSRGDLEAVKQALQLPPSVAAVLASRYSASPELASSNSSPNMSSAKLSSLDSSMLIEEEPEMQPSHQREGAFMPTPDPSTTDASVPSKEKDGNSDTKEDIQADEEALPDTGDKVVILTPPSRLDSLPKPTTQDIPAKENTSLPDILVERSLFPDHAQGPSPPPKSLRTSFTTSLKRFSTLSRSPSSSSRSPKRTSFSTIHSSRTPSPPYPRRDLTRPSCRRHKVITQNPAALFCHEVHSIRSASERCSIYIQKINDLYNCDSGLMDWLDDAKNRSTNSATKRAPSSPSTDPFTPQRRHASGSSMMTDATFPRRPDATTATDLTSSHRDISPPSVQPPALPYPSLAISQQPQRLPRSSSNSGSNTSTSIRSLVSPTPSSAPKGGFFAALGRKGSISGRREKHGITALSPSNSQSGSSGKNGDVLTRSQQPQQPQPAARPVNIAASPSVPGGPRAPPNRVKRSQTLMTTPAPFSTRPEAEASKQQPTQRPSTHDRVFDIKQDPEFVHQVDKLADLLPHADRDVLSAYLRRAGQDILAIGQYLEDEKNGTLHID